MITQQQKDALLSLLDSPKKWTKGALARNKRGDGCIWGAFDNDATCWCLRGAAIKLGIDDYDLVRSMGFETPVGLVAFNNDYRTTYDRMIERLKNAQVKELANA